MVENVNVLVVGAGMYVCGRGTSGVGTILPTLMSAQVKKQINQITVVAHSKEGLLKAKDKLDQANKLMGIKSEVSFELDLELAMKKINGIKCAIISTPDHTHTEIALKLIEKGFHLLVVKPLAPTLEEVKKIIEAQNRNNIYGAVEFHKRFDRANLKLKEAILDGKIGDPLYFIVEYSQRKIVPTDIFKNWVEETNIMQYLGVHYIDIIYFATKAKPTRVMATGQWGYLADKGLKTYDAISATIEWELENGKKFSSHIHTNWIDPDNTTAMSDQRIKVIGTKGRVESDQKYRGFFSVTDSLNVEELNPDFCQFYLINENQKDIKGYGVDSILTFIADVKKINNKEVAISDLEKIRPTFKDSMISTKIIEAANMSLRNNSDWIKI